MNDETIGNQQEIPTGDELGWLAGIIEGEGSITMNARKKSWKGWNGYGVDMQIYAVNTDMGIIEKCVKILRKMGINPYIYSKESSPIPHRDGKKFYHNKSTIHTVNVNRMGDILKLLRVIVPYIAGEKKSRANLIIEFIESRLKNKPHGQNQHTSKGYKWMDGYEWGIVKDFYALKDCEIKDPVLRKFLNDHTRTAQLCDDMV